MNSEEWITLLKQAKVEETPNVENGQTLTRIAISFLEGGLMDSVTQVPGLYDSLSAVLDWILQDSSPDLLDLLEEKTEVSLFLSRIITAGLVLGSVSTVLIYEYGKEPDG